MKCTVFVILIFVVILNILYRFGNEQGEGKAMFFFWIWEREIGGEDEGFK